MTTPVLGQVGPSLSGQGSNGFTLQDAGELFRELWYTTLFQSGEAAVQLNQIVIAFAIVIFGVLVSKAITGLLRKRLTRLKRVDEHAAVVIEKILFYLLLVVIVLVAMQVVGIPITVFTLLGGALAIGVGFGAQNIFNNLISGFIIVLEKPIRVGDIIEVANTEGKVISIGNRSTLVRRFDGIDVLLPNAHFLEQQVINWTLHDTELRGKVSVGVAYGSDTTAVREIIAQAAGENDKVNPNKRIDVIFEEFGDNALTFDLYFWTSVTTPMDMKRVRSEIRYRIDELCRERNIVIAFPQRDVHLDTLKPLEVRVQREPG
ncbi:MAG: mechanosensitive ion channel family protein [Phycisphaeraceae bacterium]